MKLFYQLTLEQQRDAISFAKNELKESLIAKTLVADRELSEEETIRLAVEAAEGSLYNDDGKPITTDMDVPWIFLGGCV